MKRSLRGALVLALAPLVLSACAQCKAKSEDRLSQAQALLASGRYGEAAQLFEQLLAEQLDRTTALGSVEALRQTGRYEDAIAICRKAMGAGLGAPFDRMLGELLAEVGDYREAERELRAAAARERGPLGGARLALARLLDELGKREEARGLFRDIVTYGERNNRATASEIAVLAQAQRYLESFHSANQTLRRATTAAPRDPELLCQRAELFLLKYDEAYAVQLYARALEVNPNYPPALLGLARARRSSNSDQALELARRALAVNPRYVAARSFLASLLIEMEEYNDALAELERALAVNPHSLEALALRAACFYLTDNQAAYQAVVKQALSLNPGYGALYQTVAEYLGQRSRYGEAAELLRRAIELDQELWSAYASLGVNLLRLGQEAEGRRYLELAFERDPFDVRTKNMLDLLDSFKDYRTIRSRNFQIKLHEREAEALGGYLTELLEEALARLARKYKFVPEGPLYFEMFPNHADFAVRTFGLPGIAASGACFGRVVVMDSPAARDVGPFNWGSTLWHELAHVITLQLSGYRIPRWFSEGLSVYEEKLARPGWGDDLNLAFLKAMAEGRLLGIKQLNRGFVRPTYPGQVPISYLQAWYICRYIVETYGFDKILQMLALYRQRLGTEEVLRAALGLGPDQFDKRFLGYLEKITERERAALDLGEPKYADMSPEQLSEILSRRPNDFFANLYLGAAYKNKSDWEAAAKHLRMAIEQFPDYVAEPNPYRLLVEVELARGREAEAIEVLEKLVSVDESDYRSHRLLAELLEKNGGRRQALEVLKSAVYINPFDATLQSKLGRLLLQEGDFRMAVVAFRSALALEPVDKPRAHVDLAEALAAAGERGEAKRHLLAALEIAPRYARAQELLLKLVE